MEKTKRCVLDEILEFNSLPTPRTLPVFMGYTVDMRLQQFRKVEFDTLPEFISFESPKGQNLIAKIIKEKFGEIYNPAKAMKVAHLLKKIGLF